MARRKSKSGFGMGPIIIVGAIVAGVLVLPSLVKGLTKVTKTPSDIITKPPSVTYGTYNQALANVTPGGSIGYSSSRGGYYTIPKEDLVTTSSVPYAGTGDEVVYPTASLPGYVPPVQPSVSVVKPELLVDPRMQPGASSIWWGYMD